MNKIIGIEHIFTICDKEKEPDRYLDLNKWMSKDFEAYYYTIESYCYKDTLKKEDVIKYNIAQELNGGNKSLYLNHIKFFEKILNNFKTGQNFLILESDAIPVKNYKKIIEDQIIKLKNKQWDYLDVGDGLGWTPANKFNYVMKEENEVYECKLSRAAHSIIWSYDGIYKFYNFIMKSKITINYPIDYMFFEIMKQIETFIYWGHPFAFEQGSLSKVYSSTNT